MIFNSCFTTIVLLLVLAKTRTDALEVTVEQGTLRGKAYKSRNGVEYQGYLGIPFAKPPVGELRFEPPQPPVPWQGVKDATQTPPRCVQHPISTASLPLSAPRGQEDCLYLNVFSGVQKSDRVPVMVFIHGGGLVSGSSSVYDVSYFMDHKVVIVTIQYRLNVFGFLSTGNKVVPGNNGMKDQVSALKWVQKNIAAFGGDPTRVTLFGESAGSGSVHYHLYSPLSKGLFHRAICQSGTSLDPWTRIPRSVAERRAVTLGALLDCPSHRMDSLVKCLREIPAEELVVAHNKFYVWDFEPLTPFSVVLERGSESDGAFLTKDPLSAVPVNQVPLIMGINSADGGVESARFLDGNGAKASYLDTHYKHLFPIIFYYKLWMEDTNRISEVSDKLRKFYFADKKIGPDTAHELTRLFTDGIFGYSAIKAANLYRPFHQVYFYYYDHRNKETFCQIFGKTTQDLGVCHGDDLISLFHLDGVFPKVTEGDDLAVSERLVKYWVNFAYTGVPNELWLPVSSDNLEYLHITTKLDQMKTRLIDERYQFWKTLNFDRNAETLEDGKTEGVADESPTTSTLFVVLLVVGIVIILSVIAAVSWFLWKRRN